MSKVGGALPSWYWPAGIPRRVPVAQQPLGKILRQRFTSFSDKPAILSGSSALTYSELLQRILDTAGGIQASAVKGAVAVVDHDAVENLILVLAAIFAGRPVFLPDGSETLDHLATQVAEARVSTILANDGSPAEFPGIGVVRPRDFKAQYNEAAGAKRGAEIAILLPSVRGVVTHSHFSLSAMAASLAAFIPKLREMTFICMATSPGRWETLSGILLALMHGAPVVFGTAQSAPAAISAEAYTIIGRGQADAIVASGRTPKFLSSATYVFVSTGVFDPRWRRRLERAFGKPIFPIWGLPEVGPVVAAHPTWLPPHGHGFPLVNVSLMPIEPVSGKMSIVPWEMLEQAEMGVETLSAMPGYVDASRSAAMKVGTALRTGQIVTMDHVGVVILQGASATAVGGNLAGA